MTGLVAFGDLKSADLVVGTVYEGGSAGNKADDPVAHLLPVGNSGGIRYKGSADDCRLVALVSSLEHPSWPDEISAGVLTYYGDNDKHLADLGEPSGNRLMKRLFRRGFGDVKTRLQAPPMFVFTKANVDGLPTRSIRFEGIAVPGARTVPAEDWLVAKWFPGSGGRFENYVLTATLLRPESASRSWIDEILDGDPDGTSCPVQYRRWILDGLG